MVKSMTGYGIAKAKLKSRIFSIEAKSVNHKFCEVHLRLPPHLASLESKIQSFMKGYFSRGRIDLWVREENQNSQSASFKIDHKRLSLYYKDLEKAAKSLNLNQEISLEFLFNLPQVIVYEEQENIDELWAEFKPLLIKTLQSLEKMRILEGKATEKFLNTQLQLLQIETRKITHIIPKNIINHQKLLQDRVEKLLNTVPDPQRVAQEIAYFVDRTDVSEELQRFNHHIQHFKKLLKQSDPVGRKLDFLLQELNREVNTLSAKAQNSEISQSVVECKHVLEKMREQVQNIE